MSILTTSEIREAIVKELRVAHDQIQIVTAYCKIPAVEFIDCNCTRDVPSKKLLVRFLLSDILQGATDFHLYDYCKQNGWQLYMRFDLHAKTYIFDRKRCIIGSANLTNNGLGLNFHGNYELSAIVDVLDDDLQKVDSLFNNAILMTDELNKAMREDFERAKATASRIPNPKWRNEITYKFNPPIDTLFTYDFPSVSKPILNTPETYDFLNCTNQITSMDDLRSAFRWSKSFLWLLNHLRECDNFTDYFGSITAALHNTLINDPKPYRKEVKLLLANLFSWIQSLGIEEICLDTPNHSQRVRLVS